MVSCLARRRQHWVVLGSNTVPLSVILKFRLDGPYGIQQSTGQTSIAAQYHDACWWLSSWCWTGHDFLEPGRKMCIYVCKMRHLLTRSLCCSRRMMLSLCIDPSQTWAPRYHLLFGLVCIRQVLGAQHKFYIISLHVTCSPPIWPEHLAAICCLGSSSCRYSHV
jgi:hypothetical protein